MATRDGTLVWSDEFDGAAGGVPDPTVWRAEIGGGGWGCGQSQTYTDHPANGSLDGEGHLAIVARREPDGDITSARLITTRLLHVRFGRVAARIKVPPGRGLWPAFWMLGTDIDEVGWPDCGEIDIMEVVGSQPTVVHGTLHGPGFAGLAHGVGNAHDAGVDLADDFHVYAVDWAPNRITWLLDGEPYATLTPADVPGGTWQFRHDHFLLLNLAVGGDWPGNTSDDQPLPATMLVDWVRVYDGLVTVGAA